MKKHLFLILVWLLPATSSSLWARGARRIEEWQGTWSAAPMQLPVPAVDTSGDVTWRSIVRISAGGDKLRIRLSNDFGTAALMIGSVHIALSASGKVPDGSIQAGTDRTVTFGGRPGVKIPPHSMVMSDAVSLTVASLSRLDVSIYLPKQTLEKLTCHRQAWSTNFEGSGDLTATASMRGDRRIQSWCFLSGIDVLTHGEPRAIVAFGDSITDGGHSTPDTNHRWPDFLADRLSRASNTAHIGVLNEGIGGNCMLHDTRSVNALARFDRDVLAQSGVKYLFIMIGINDLGRLAKHKRPGHGASAHDLIFGFSQMIQRAHDHGIKVIGATLTPYEGAGYFSAAGEREREEVNQWIRASGTFDEVVDFDKILRDPAHPLRLLPAFDHGDHLHPNDAGYKVMADSIPLKWFK